MTETHPQGTIVVLCSLRLGISFSSFFFLFFFFSCVYILCLIWMVWGRGGRWPYSCCFMGCCLQDLFNTACNILAQLLLSFFSTRLVSVHVVYPYSSIDTTASWKKMRLILSGRPDFHMTDCLLKAVHAFVSRVLMSFSVVETPLLR